MRKRTVGTIYLIIGLFLSILYPISSVSNGVSSIGWYVPIDPLDYWLMWMVQYGVLTVILVLIGVYFVMFGYRCRKFYPKAKVKKKRKANQS